MAEPSTAPAAMRRAVVADVRDVVIALTCLAIVVLAEGTFLLGGLVAGIVAAILAIGGLLAIATLERGRLSGRIAVGLAVLPLLRLLSIAVPSVLTPTWLWFAEIGIAVLVATGIAATIAGISPAELGLRGSPPQAILAAAMVGVLLGLVAHALAPLDATPASRAPGIVLAATASIVVGGAVAEELLYRGLLQVLADDLTGGLGVPVAAGLSTLMYLATANLPYILFIAVVSLGLGVVTRRLGSLAPAIACHGLLLWTQLLLWPALLG